MTQTTDRTLVTLSLSTAASLCALASLKKERGDLLIKSDRDIERELRRLIDGKLVGSVDDDFSINVGDFFYMINNFGQGYIVADKYDKNRLAVDKKTILFFQECVANDLKFGSQEVYNAILNIANFLRAPEIPIEAAKKIDDKIKRFELCQYRHSGNPAYKEMLAVLIPLACMSAYDKLAVYEGTPELVAKHQGGCRYCKKYFEIMGVTPESEPVKVALES